MISYTPLWHTLINKGMNKGDLKNMTGLSFGTIASMGKNEPVNLKQIDRICKALHCKIEDVIEYKEDKMLPYIYLTNVRFWLPAITMRDAMILI